MNLSEDQFHTLRHMLGINDLRKRDASPYRNYYCANKNDNNMAELVSIGAVKMYKSDDEYDFFTCTPEGKEAAICSFYAERAKKVIKRLSA